MKQKRHKNSLKNRKSSIPWDSLQGLSETSPKWRMAAISSQRTASSLSLFFSELDKSAQGSSVILCVAVEGDLSFSDKGLVLVNVRFHPRPGIYGNGWHCVCSLPSYTTECKGLHNKTIHCVHAINFYPEDVSRTLDKWWFTQSFATVQMQQRYNRCHCGVQQFTVQFIEFTYFKELQDLTQFTLNINEMVSLYLQLPDIIIKGYHAQTTQSQGSKYSSFAIYLIRNQKKL